MLDRNWRDGPRELDLVIRRGQVLAFVEVKTRRRGQGCHPLESIGRRKREELQRAARAWLGSRGEAVAEEGHPRFQCIRFDAIVVWLRDGREASVEHVPDAWRPGWKAF